MLHKCNMITPSKQIKSSSNFVSLTIVKVRYNVEYFNAPVMHSTCYLFHFLLKYIYSNFCGVSRPLSHTIVACFARWTLVNDRNAGKFIRKFRVPDDSTFRDNLHETSAMRAIILVLWQSCFHWLWNNFITISWSWNFRTYMRVFVSLMIHHFQAIVYRSLNANWEYTFITIPSILIPYITNVVIFISCEFFRHKAR